MRQAVQQNRVQQGVWRVRTARTGLHIRLPGAQQACVQLFENIPAHTVSCLNSSASTTSHKHQR